uniref:THAP-type domain-containing protein n=1 Tax=Oryzias melastigma TaxID=30732 RepID=A0A3B3D3M2_ORYME
MLFPFFCSVYGNHHDEFPLARPDVCGKWVAAMRRNNFKPTKYSNICSQHFTKDCFKRECNNRVLKENAVPSLFSFNLSIKVSRLTLQRPTDEELWNHGKPCHPEEEPEGGTPCTRTDTAVVSCDHNYTAEDSAQQKKRIDQLEEQLEHLRKKLKTTQQKCRRQERQLRRLKAACEGARSGREPAPSFSEGYVILPKHIYHTLKEDFKPMTP